MKKLLAAIITLIIAVCGVACGLDDPADVTKEEYVFVMPDGAPVLAAVNLIKNYPEIDGHKMTYKVVTPSTIATEYAQNAQIAVMPTNAAANLYNKKVDVKLASVNVFGLMYMIGQNSLNSLEDLKGKVIYSIGEGNTPDLLMKYFLNKAGVEYVKSDEVVADKAAFVYVADGSNAIQAMKMWQTGKSTKRVDYAVIGQPAATNALSKLENTSIVFDFQSEWIKDAGSNYPQAGVVVKSKVGEDSSFIAALRKALSENYAYISANPSAVSEVLEANNSTLKGVTFDKSLIDACNIGYLTAKDAKTALENYFTKATEHDAESTKFFGGVLPADDFYLA